MAKTTSEKIDLLVKFFGFIYDCSKTLKENYDRHFQSDSKKTDEDTARMEETDSFREIDLK